MPSTKTPDPPATIPSSITGKPPENAYKAGYQAGYAKGYAAGVRDAKGSGAKKSKRKKRRRISKTSRNEKPK